MKNMKKTNITFYILIFCTIFCYSNLLAANPIDYARGKFAMDKGNELLSKGNYDSALKEYERAKSFLNESDILYYNIANTFFKKGDYMGSTMAYEYAKNYISEKTSNKLKSDIYYNSGVNHIEMENYSEAIVDLIEALKVNPKSSNSISALEYARKRLEEQEKQQNSSNDQQDDSDNSEQNDSDEDGDSDDNNQDSENEQEQSQEQVDQSNNKDSITPEEAKRILDAIRNDRDDSEDTRQNYKGGKNLENDW